MTLYFGTYTDNESKGIYSAYFDEKTGYIGTAKLFCEVCEPKYLCVSDDKVFSVFKEGDKSGVLVISKTGDIICKKLYEEHTSCFIAVDGEYVYTANYHDGTITKLLFRDNKLEILKQVKGLDGAHQTYIHENIIFVPCLKLDKVYIFDMDLNEPYILECYANYGPRHIAIKDDFMYVACELSAKLLAISLRDDLRIVSETSLSNGSCDSSPAAIRIKDDKVFVSIRGENIVTVLDISKNTPQILYSYSTKGDHPRDILNIGKYLLVANRTEGEILSFDLDFNDIIKVKVPEIVCIVTDGRV